ncbi:host-nuclease inhibitor Gam family protein [Gracilibacillus saliphilus]|uniref:host-nuclease inhibitor Gam family protein n=1 Tax=Gracilibacillus saliphilus TaxID=543890 RepID=UPI0013D15AA9|nr:host-nuclease inhibitor Gam family protein [Gracilibacillus saliphilus]
MELQEYLEQEEQTNEPFKVTDDSSANWTLRVIKELQDQIKDNSELAQSEIEKIESWETQEKEKLQKQIDRFESLLAQYAMERREEDPNFKSRKLPNGYIGFRNKQPKWNYNEEALVNFLKQAKMDEYINVTITEKPDKKAIKKAFKVEDGKVIDEDTGFLVDGITVEEQGEDFTVKVDD